MTRLTKTRKATKAEKKEFGAQVVFTRKGNGQIYTIFGCLGYFQDWEQWGAPTEVLNDNVNTIDEWYKNFRG